MQSPTFFTPHKLCKCLLITYFTKKHPPLVKRKLSSFILKEVKSNQSEREQSWDTFCRHLETSLAPHHTDVISWLVKKLGVISSPDDLEEIIQMLKITEKNYFLANNRAQSSTLGIYLQEVLLAYEGVLFEGLSRLFIQMQNFLPTTKSLKSHLQIKKKTQASTPIQERFIYSDRRNIQIVKDEHSDIPLSPSSTAELLWAGDSSRDFSDSVISMNNETDSNLLEEEEDQSFDLDAIIDNVRGSQTSFDMVSSQSFDLDAALQLNTSSDRLSHNTSSIIGDDLSHQDNDDNSFAEESSNVLLQSHHQQQNSFFSEENSFQFEGETSYDDVNENATASRNPSLHIHVDDELILHELKSKKSGGMNWEACEASWFPCLHEIRSRRTNSFPHGALSASEVQQFVAFQANRLQNVISSGNYQESSKQIEEQIERLRETATEESSVHYLAYLHHKQQRNFTKAQDELHRYFDYQIYQRSTSIVDIPVDPPANKLVVDHNLLSFASLQLACLYYDFNAYEEGLNALRESIRMAQERNDHECLTRALYWLFCFLQRTPQQQGLTAHNKYDDTERQVEILMKEFVQQSASRAVTHNLPYWASLHLFSLVEMHLHSVNQQPERMWHHLLRAEHLATLNGFSDLSVTSQLLRSSIWANCGNQDLTSLHNQLALYHLQQTDNISVSSQVTLQDEPYGVVAPSASLEDVCTVYCKLAYEHWQAGRSAESFNALLQLKSNIHHLSSETSAFLMCCSSILIEYCLLRGNYTAAKALLGKRLFRNDNSLYQFDTLEYYCRLHLCLNDFTSAFQCTEKLHDILRDSQMNDVLAWKQRLRLYMLLSEVYLKAGQSLVALSHVLTTISLCVRHNNYNSHAQACLLLIDIYLELQQVESASQLLQLILPQVVHHSPLLLQAKIHLASAKINFFRSSHSESMDSEEARNKLWHSAKQHLNKSQTFFELLEATDSLKETHYYQAIANNALSDFTARDLSSSQFQQMETLAYKRNTNSLTDFFKDSPHASSLGPLLDLFIE